MQNEQMADILAVLAQHLAEIVEGDMDGVYLYAEADGGSYDAGIFKDIGNGVQYFSPDAELFDELRRLWAAADVDEKWHVLHYTVRGAAFEASFEFQDSMDPDEFIQDRRKRALHQRYGDKPVIYPPMEDYFHEISEADLSDD